MSPRTKRARTWRNDEAVHAYLFILPSLLGMAVFVVLPVIISAGLSFTSWNLLQPPQFVGLANFIRLFTDDPVFMIALKNTVYYSVLTIPGTILVSLILALLMNRMVIFPSLFRTLFFLPYVCTMVAVAMTWRWIYNVDFGLLNYLLETIGLEPQRWLQDPALVIPSLAIMSIWKTAGWGMVIYLAGLQGIPEHLYEAARLDGANFFQQTVYITVPLLAPTTFFLVIMSFIGSFQVFDQVYMMTSGGPGYASTVYNYYLYANAFRYFRMGYAAAMAWVLFFILFALSFVQFKFFGKSADYQL